jgi:hypothetical protein
MFATIKAALAAALEHLAAGSHAQAQSILTTLHADVAAAEAAMAAKITALRHKAQADARAIFDAAEAEVTKLLHAASPITPPLPPQEVHTPTASPNPPPA